MDIHAYRAKQFRDSMEGSYVSDVDTVLDIITSKGEIVKKEEIVEIYMKRKNLDPEAAKTCVGQSLSKLLAAKKIKRFDRGYYMLYRAG